MGDISDLYKDVEKYGALNPDYYEKMIHQIPKAPVWIREKYILEHCRGLKVLDIGCTGKLHLLIEKKALECHGLDVLTPEEAKAHCQCDYWQVDLDEAKHLPYLDIQLIVCGEIIEHLSNAGHFLQLLRRTKCPVILTTPNALNDVVRRYAEMNIEQVNKQHVAWYSYHTLKTLVERHGFKVLEWGWYGGKPVFAEGLIFLLG